MEILEPLIKIMNELDGQIYTVAVSAQPVVWAVQCDICDDIVSIETEDDDLIDTMETRHKHFHAVLKINPENAEDQLDKQDSNPL